MEMANYHAKSNVWSCCCTIVINIIWKSIFVLAKRVYFWYLKLFASGYKNIIFFFLYIHTLSSYQIKRCINKCLNAHLKELYEMYHSSTLKFYIVKRRCIKMDLKIEALWYCWLTFNVDIFFLTCIYIHIKMIFT